MCGTDSIEDVGEEGRGGLFIDGIMCSSKECINKKEGRKAGEWLAAVQIGCEKDSTCKDKHVPTRF